MPPEENTNKNIPGPNKIKIGIDPVFKGNIPKKIGTVDQNNPISAYGVLNNQKYTPSQPPITIPLDSLSKKSTSPKSIVRTYKSDLESAIQKDHLSSINIAIAENQKMHEQIKSGIEKAASESEYSKNKIILFASLILIIIGIVAILATYLLKNPNSTTQIQELPSLITTEYKDTIDINTITKGNFVNTLSSKLNNIQIPVNNLYNAYITAGTSTVKRLITSPEFVNLMRFDMPDIIKRTFLPDFMVGTYSFGKNLPFIIFKTSSFENTYAGMLDWEKDLEKNLQVLFRLSGYESPGGILVDLTPTNAKSFEDGVIVNKDVRLLRGDDGQIILLYGIIDKETIVITVNDTAFKEIIDRLNKEKGLKR